MFTPATLKLVMRQLSRHPLGCNCRFAVLRIHEYYGEIYETCPLLRINDCEACLIQHSTYIECSMGANQRSPTFVTVLQSLPVTQIFLPELKTVSFFLSTTTTSWAQSRHDGFYGHIFCYLWHLSLFAGTGQGAYLSTNNGTTWTAAIDSGLTYSVCG